MRGTERATAPGISVLSDGGGAVSVTSQAVFELHHGLLLERGDERAAHQEKDDAVQDDEKPVAVEDEVDEGDNNSGDRREQEDENPADQEHVRERGGGRHQRQRKASRERGTRHRRPDPKDDANCRFERERAHGLQ